MSAEIVRSTNQSLILQNPVEFIGGILPTSQLDERSYLIGFRKKLLNEWWQINSLILKAPFEDVVFADQSKRKARTVKISNKIYLREWQTHPENQILVILHYEKKLPNSRSKGSNHKIRVIFKLDRNREYLRKIKIEDTSINNYKYHQRVLVIDLANPLTVELPQKQRPF